MSTASRGSSPRSTLTRRSARTISCTATVTIPSAHSSSPRPRRSARSPTTAAAASPSSRTPPARGRSAGKRPSTTLASVTVGSVPPCPYAAGPGRAPAECGPTRRAPPESIHAMLPPPADTVATSSIGRCRGWPAISVLLVRAGVPSRTRATSHEVPPMSKVRASRASCSAASRAAPITPPAGPLRTVHAACSAESAIGSTPPLDCMIAGAGRPASDARPASRPR